MWLINHCIQNEVRADNGLQGCGRKYEISNIFTFMLTKIKRKYLWKTVSFYSKNEICKYFLSDLQTWALYSKTGVLLKVVHDIRLYLMVNVSLPWGSENLNIYLYVGKQIKAPAAQPEWVLIETPRPQ